LKHDGYRLQIHVRDGRVRLYTINGADWSKRYPLIVETAARINGTAILDAEVVWLGLDGVPDFERVGWRHRGRHSVSSRPIPTQGASTASSLRRNLCLYSRTPRPTSLLRSRSRRIRSHRNLCSCRNLS
jgi:hypothetical protein